jgi:hypothetical protein
VWEHGGIAQAVADRIPWRYLSLDVRASRGQGRFSVFRRSPVWEHGGMAQAVADRIPWRYLSLDVLRQPEAIRFRGRA